MFKIPSLYRRVVVYDLDDTLFATETAFVKWIWENLGVRHTWTNRMDIKDPVEGPLLGPTLEAAEFMRDGHFVAGFEGVPEMIAQITERYPDVFQMFATHRGYSKKAPAFTQEQFTRLNINLPGVFLDPAVDSCKKTWLDKNLEGREYYLFDDNPHWKGSSQSNADNIFLMDKPWNQHETGYQRIYDFDGMEKQIHLRLSGI